MTNSILLIARKYRWKYSGMVAFWTQRLTGLALPAAGRAVCRPVSPMS